MIRSLKIPEIAKQLKSGEEFLQVWIYPNGAMRIKKRLQDGTDYSDTLLISSSASAAEADRVLKGELQGNEKLEFVE